MRSYAWVLVAALALGGCNVATWGNIVVVAMTLAIFCGTLSLGRRGADPTDEQHESLDRGPVES